MEDLKHLALLMLGILVAFFVVMTMVAYTVLAERRVLGFIQGRLGPNRVGPGGFLQPLADLIKFIFKEDIVPDKSTRFVYFLAPIIATVAALMTIVVYPFGPEVNLPFHRPDSAGDRALRRRAAVCAWRDVGRCLRHRARRLVVE